MSHYKVAVLSGKREITFIEPELKQPTGRQVLVKVEYCAICTLEQRVYGGVIDLYPFAGGHEVSGIVKAVGDKVKNLKPGDKVTLRLLTSCGECYYCRNGHENQCVVSFIANIQEGVGGPGGLSQYMMMEAESVYKVDDDINLAYAALTEPLACCVHSVNNARVEFGNDVVVIGCGIMGAFHTQLAKKRGARVIACEVDGARLEVAKKMGADIVIDSSKTYPVEKVWEITEGRGADVVFCTSAITSLSSQSITMAGKLGRIVLYSSFHPASPIELDVNRVHYNESVITGSVNPNKRDFLASSRMLSYGIIDVSQLISGVFPIAQVNEAFQKAIEPASYRILVKCSEISI